LSRYRQHGAERFGNLPSDRQPFLRLGVAGHSRQRFSHAAGPDPLFFASDPKQAIDYASESSRTTHATKAAVDACRYFAGLTVGALRGKPKSELLSSYFNPTDEPNFWNENGLDSKIAAIAAGSFKKKDPPEIRGTGYVVESLEEALWAFDRSESFRKGALLAVNLGDDADTTGAIYGQIAGAFYVADGIPAEWRAKLTLFPAL
jgi:ADP-ribosyl-[dinitrogen reductase] hydrolase